MYVDQPDDDTMRLLKEYHRDDILSMDHYNASVLASACHDGNILIWSLTTGRLLFCLNAHKSHKQIRAANYFKAGFEKDGDHGEDPETGEGGEKLEEVGELEAQEGMESKEKDVNFDGGDGNESVRGDHGKAQEKEVKGSDLMQEDGETKKVNIQYPHVKTMHVIGGFL